MATKRPLPSPEEAEDGGGSRALKRCRSLIPELLGKQLMPQFMVELELEKILRRVVREELMRSFANHVLPARLLSNQDQEIRYRLHFQNKPPNEVFTFKNFLAEDGTNLQIALMDSNLREVITSDPLSSAKVEIVVIQGDFVSDRHENWTEKKFKDHVVPPRNGKGPVLTGELVIKLNKGVGYLVHATFTDNSSWTRSQKFRLGVRLSQSESIKDRVQEGISEPLRVKDRRVASNQKRDSPSLTDEVWRLKYIMKDGKHHKSLVDGRIHTVQQFLQAFNMNHERLRCLLGYKAENQKWQKIVTCAQKCPVGNELYSYKVSGQNIVLIFNSIYQLIGAKFDGHYRSMDNLTAFEQKSVDHWKKLAVENPNDINIMADNLSLPMVPTSVPSVPRSISVDPQMPYSNGKNHDEATSQVDLWHQPNALDNECLNVSFQPEHIFVDGVHSIQGSSSFQEPEVPSKSVDHWKKLAFENPNDIDIMADNLLLPIAPTSVPSVPGSISMDPQMPYSNDEATSQVDLWHQPNAPDNECSNVSFQPKHIFVDGVHSIQGSSSFQEPEVSSKSVDHWKNFTFENPNDMDIMADNLRLPIVPTSVPWKNTHMNDISDDLSFRTGSCAGRVDQCMPDDECQAMIREYLQTRWKWVKLIAGLKCGISIIKHMAAKKTGIPMPSSCVGIRAGP